MSNKADQVSGVVTVAVGGITASLTAGQAAEWGSVLMSLAPLVLIGFLIWRIRMLDKQLTCCQENHHKVTNQLTLAYMAMREPKLAEKLPSQEVFLSGDFDLGECLKDFCEPKE